MQRGEQAITDIRPDLVVLDLCLPDGHGAALVKRVRETSTVPIVAISVPNRPDEMVQALDSGADDYQTKPFDNQHLLARLRAILRRSAMRVHSDPSSHFRVGELSVDLLRRRVTMRGNAIRLTPVEYKLLVVLIEHAGGVVSQQELLTEVWGRQKEDCRLYARVYVAALRRKLESDPASPRYLLTEPRVGYRLICGQALS